MFFNFNGDILDISSLYLDGKGAAHPDHLYIGGGYYEVVAYRHNWTHKSWGGNIPVIELIKWAKAQGYISDTMETF